MTKEKLAQRIKSIIGDSERLEKSVRVMSLVDLECFPKEYGVYHAGAQRQAEWLACRLRHLLYETTLIRKSEYLLQAAERLEIQCSYENGIFQITLPGIVSGGRRRPSEFLFDPLDASLEYYIKHEHSPRYHQCVVCFVHIFDRNVCGRASLDANDLELKRHLDTAAAFLLIDDRPKYLDVYYAAELGDRHAVEMYFMERDHFPQWLGERERNREKPSAEMP